MILSHDPLEISLICWFGDQLWYLRLNGSR